MTDVQRNRTVLERASRVPIVDTLRMRLSDFADGRCRVTVPYEKRYNGIFDSFHGGLLMTIADSAACFAIMTLIGPEEVLTTTDMNIRFLAPCLTDAVAEARVIKLGRTLCPVAVDLYDLERKPVAVAQVTYIRLKQKTVG